MSQLFHALGGEMQITQLLVSTKPAIAHRAALALARASEQQDIVQRLAAASLEFWIQLAALLATTDDDLIVSSALQAITNVACNSVDSVVVHSNLLDSNCIFQICQRFQVSNDPACLVTIGNLICSCTNHSEILLHSGIFRSLIDFMFTPQHELQEHALNTLINCIDAPACRTEFIRLGAVQRILNVLHDIDLPETDTTQDHFYGCFVLLLECLKECEIHDGIEMFFRFLGLSDATFQEYSLAVLIELLSHGDQALLCTEIGRSGVLSSIVWLLQHEQAAVVDKARDLVELLRQKQERFPILLVEQGCVPILYSFLTKDDHFAVELLRWIRDQLNDRVLDTLISIMRTRRVNEILRHNIAVALVLVSNSLIASRLIDGGGLDGMIALLQSTPTRKYGVEFLRSIESLMDFDLITNIKLPHVEPCSGQILLYMEDSPEPLRLSKQNLFGASHFFSQNRIRSEYEIPRYSFDFVQRIAKILLLSSAAQQRTLQQPEILTPQLIQVFEFSQEYQCPGLLDSAGYALAERVDTGTGPALLTLALRARHPALMIRSFRVLLKNIDTVFDSHPKLIAQTCSAFRQLLVELVFRPRKDNAAE